MSINIFYNATKPNSVMKLKNILLINFFIFVFSISYSQQWMENVPKEEEQNFYKIQEEFKKHWEGKDFKQKGIGWKQFKRWEWFWESRIYPSGVLPQPDILKTKIEAHLSQFPNQKSNASANWTLIGPNVIPANGGGVGRINCVAVHPTNTSIIFTGSAAGGLWKSTNGGTTWTTNTDNFGSLGVSSIAFDPVNSDIMYIATGDGDVNDTYSIGILKSTDGGNSWNQTGLNWTQSQVRRISTVIVHPTDANIILSATSNGVYRSSNAGVSWTQVATGDFKDLEVNKTNPTIWYAAYTGNGIYKSTNTGTSFTKLTSGLPTSGFGRIAISVAQSYPSTIYGLYVNANQGYYGLYKSTNDGSTWTQQSTSPNVLSWDGTGTDGQGWYDLVLDTDPTNANTVYVGGVNMYKSADGGVNWTKISHWYSGAGYPYVHADMHGFTFMPNSPNTIFSGNDGGIFKSTDGGSSWTDLSGGGLAVTQFYKLGTSQTNVNRIYAGAQDNGTDRYLSGAWRRIIGGDGMEALIDYSNEQIGYGELYYGDIHRTTNGGTSFSSIRSGITEDGGWVTPYVINPINPRSLYLGTTKVYKTVNRGDSWSAISSALTGSTFDNVVVSPSDTNTLYVSDGSRVFKTTNGGTNWSEVSTGVAGFVTYIAIHPTNPQIVYITISGFGTTKVQKSINGGTSWTNMSTGLPSIPTNCISIHPNNSEQIVVGTDVGIYYSGNGGTSWELFSTGLPNVIVNELEFHLSSNKLRAATYGRGIWETPFTTIQLGSIAGTVFNDANNNGIKDANESMLSNWKVKLSGAKVDSMMTDGNGNYNFFSLNDGNYQVSQVVQTGWTQTLPTNNGIYSVTITSANSITGKDFGNYKPSGNISGIVFNDANNNGTKDANEIGLSNWKVKINGPQIDSIFTDVSGNYSFISIPVGTYTISEEIQNGWTLTYPNGGTHTINLSSGQNVVDKSFGNYSLFLVNESFESATFPPSGWTNAVVAGSGSGWIRKTDIPHTGSGYAFCDFQAAGTNGSKMLITSQIVSGTGQKTLKFWVRRGFASIYPPDTLYVKISTSNTPSNFTTTIYKCYTGDTTGGNPNIYSRTYKEFVVNFNFNGNFYLAFDHQDNDGQSLFLDGITLNESQVLLGSVSGTVFNDANNNGIKDANESMLSNWKVKLNGAKVDSFITDANGIYTFSNLSAGTYTISEVVQSGWILTYPNGGTHTVNLSAGQNVVDKNFGNYLQLGSITGVVFLDNDGDGIKDANESGIQNIKVKLSGTKVDSVITNANGSYTFSSLSAGSYTISEETQNGWILTYPNGETHTVNLSAGQNVIDKNFGVFQYGKLNGNIFYDENGNGIKDANESGISNWKVKLSGSKTDSFFTDASGNFVYEKLKIGNYTLTEVIQNNWYQTFPINTHSFSVPSSGMNITDKNFGNSQYGSISGIVFVDNNGNGIKDVGENSVSNWKVKLSGEKLDSVITNENGNYTFSSLRIGNYNVSLSLQSGFISTFPTLSSYSFYLTSGTNAIDKNFGVFQYGTISGIVFEDINGNSIQDGNEVGVQNIKVKLSGAKVDSVITNASGNYSFISLLSGNYSIAIELPNNSEQTFPQSQVSILIQSGETSFQKFGIFKLGFVSGNVFNDLNGNQTKDANEIGISNAKIVALNNNINDTSSTDANGNFIISNLRSGNLSINVFAVSNSNIINSSTQKQYTITSGFQSVENYFDIFYPSTISGKKYHDLNANGTLDNNETGIENATIYLSKNSSFIDSVQTNANGEYIFTNLQSGSYSVFSSPSYENGVIENSTYEIVSTSGSENSNYNFAEYRYATLTVENYIDGDNDISTTDDRSEKEWTTSIYNNNELITTQNSFSIVLENLIPGNYSISRNDSLLYDLIAVLFNDTNILSQNENISFTLQSNENSTVQFVSIFKDTSKFRTFISSIDFSLKANKLSVKNKVVTVANVRDTVAKYLKGITLGLPQTHQDSLKQYGWMYWKTGTDVSKFYTSAHTLSSKPFDSIRVEGKKAKVFLKLQKLTRKVYNNPLAEQFTIFKINVGASLYGITPTGFIDLIYEKDGSIFDGMSLGNMAIKIDTIMTKWKYNGSSFDYEAVKNSLVEINSAFYSTLNDTDIISISPLQIDGNKMLFESSFLQRGNSLRNTLWLNSYQGNLPTEFLLSQNYPNPFNPNTTISFSLVDMEFVSLKIYDILGREIKTLINNEEMESGFYEIDFDATNLNSGIYFYKLTTNNFSEMKKMILIK